MDQVTGKQLPARTMDPSMIDWLVQTTAAHPKLARGVPPPGLMSAVELAHFFQLHGEKRRRDRLLGRWTCKRLLQYVVSREEGQFIPLARLEIENDASGAPRLGNGVTRGFCSFSISHSQDHAFCAALTHPGITLGADIEYVEPRATSFVDDYFTSQEQAIVARSPKGTRSLLVTAIWSAKEAALKSLQVGLRKDTRTINCALEPVAGAPEEWTSYTISLADGRSLPGWWRAWSDYVLTLAALEA